MKKLLSVLLSIAMCFTLTTPAFAATTSNNSTDSTVSVFSPEYPDAYFEYEAPTPITPSSTSPNGEPLHTITVTAFCEEAYNTETGEILYSRLMNKDEVAEWRAKGSPTEPIPLSSWGDVSSMGELDITLTVFQLANDGSSGYNTNLLARGQAHWAKGPSWGAGATRPSWGIDVMGISWGKGLDCFSHDQTATSNKGEPVDIAICDTSDNEFISWMFTEQFGLHVGSIGGAEWARDVECSAGLGVPTSVYNQTTDIALTYAHSYSDVVVDDLTVHVSASLEGGLEGGLDVSFGTKADDWSIVAIAHNVDL